MSVVAIIPARGGSKRIPHKNLMPIAGRPLLAWTAEAALSAKKIDRVILSTDSNEIAAFGRSVGLEVPFLRPAEIAADATPMLPVLQHAVGWLQQNGGVDTLVLLQPTSPGRESYHIDDAVTLIETTQCGSVVSVVAAPHQFNPWKLLVVGDDGGLSPFMETPYRPVHSNTVELPTVYGRNGPSIVVCHAKDVLRGELYMQPSLPYVMSPENSVDIDTPFDLELAEWLLKRSQARSKGVIPH